MIQVEYEICVHQASLADRRYGLFRAIRGCFCAGVGVVWTVWDFSVALDFWRFYFRGSESASSSALELTTSRGLEVFRE